MTKINLKTIAVSLIITLTLTQILPVNQAEAALQVVKNFSGQPDFGGGTSFPVMIQKSAFEESKQGIIYLIQDAHTSLEAQQQITQALSELRNKKQLDAVLVEGASGKLTDVRFQNYPQLRKNFDFIKNLEARGLLHGAGAFYLLHPDTQVEGMENAQLYRQNLEAFKKVYQLQGSVQTDIERLRVMWQQWLKKNGPEKNREFFLQSSGVRRDLDHLEYFKRLLQLSEETLQMDWGLRQQKLWPNLIRIQRLLELETNFDKEKILQELKKFKRAFGKTWNAEIKEIEQTFQSPRNQVPEKKSQVWRAFAARLLKEAKQKNIPILSYATLFNWLAALVLREEINPELLIEESERLEDQIWKKTFHSLEGRTYRELGRLLGLLDQAQKLELSRKQVKQLRLALNGEAASLIKSNPLLLQWIYAVLNFYILAERRESAFLQRTNEVAAWAAQNRRLLKPKIAVVVGGYHQEGLRKKWEREWNVVVMTPRLSSVQKDIAYQERILNSSFESSLLSISPAALETPGQLIDLVGVEAARAPERELNLLGLNFPNTSNAPKKFSFSRFRLSLLRWIAVSFVFLFSTVFLNAQSQSDPIDSGLSRLQTLGAQVREKQKKSFEENSPLIVVQEINFSRGLNWKGGRVISPDAIIEQHPSARRQAIQALLQNEMRSRYLSLGLEIKTPSGTTHKLTDFSNPLGLAYAALRGAVEGLEETVSASAQNKADKAFAAAWKKEWEIQVRKLETQALGLAVEIQKNYSEWEWYRQLEERFEKLAIQANDREATGLEKLGTATGVNIKWLQMTAKLKDLQRTRETFLAELAFTLGVSVENIDLADILNLRLPAVPDAWFDPEVRIDLANTVLEAVSSGLSVQAAELLAEGRRLDVKAEKPRGIFSFNLRVRGNRPSSISDEKVSGRTPEQRKSRLLAADSAASAEITQSETYLWVRQNLDELWRLADEAQIAEQALIRYEADRPLLENAYSAAGPEVLTWFENVETASSRLRESRAKSAQILAALVGAGVLKPTDVYIARAWIGSFVTARSEARVTFKHILSWALLGNLFLSSGYAAVQKNVEKNTKTNSVPAKITKWKADKERPAFDSNYQAAEAPKTLPLSKTNTVTRQIIQPAEIIQSAAAAPEVRKFNANRRIKNVQAIASGRIRGAKLGSGPAGGYVINAFSEGTVEITASGKAWVKDLKRENEIKDSIARLELLLEQTLKVSDEARSPQEKLQADAERAVVQLKLSRLLQQRSELDRLEGISLRSGAVLAASGSVRAGEPLIEIFPNQAVAVEINNIPLRNLTQKQFGLEINGERVELTGSVRVLQVDPNNQTVSLRLTAKLPENVQTKSEFNFQIYSFDFENTNSAIQQGEPVRVIIGTSETQVVAQREISPIRVPRGQSGIFELSTGGRVRSGEVLVKRKSDTGVAGYSFPEELGFAKSVLAQIERILSHPEGQAAELLLRLRKTNLELAQLLEQESAAIVVAGKNGLWVPNSDAAVLPSPEGSELGGFYSDHVILGSDADLAQMIMVPKAAKTQVGDILQVVTAAGKKFSGKVTRVIETIPAQNQENYRDLDAIIIEAVSPADQIIEWPTTLDPIQLFEWLQRAEEKPRAEISEKPAVLLAQVSAPRSILASGPISTDGSLSSIQLNPNQVSLRVQAVLQEHNPVKRKKVFEEQIENYSANELAVLLAQASPDVVFEMTRFLISKKSWPPVIGALNASKNDSERLQALSGAVQAELAVDRREVIESGLNQLGFESRSSAFLRRAANSIFATWIGEWGINHSFSRRILDSGYFTRKELADFSESMIQSGNAQLKKTGEKIRILVWMRLAADRIQSITKSPYLKKVLEGQDPEHLLVSPSSTVFINNLVYEHTLRQDETTLLRGVLFENSGVRNLIDPETASKTSVGTTDKPERLDSFPVIGTSASAIGFANGLETPELREADLKRQAEKGDFFQALSYLNGKSTPLKKAALSVLQGSAVGRKQLYSWLASERNQPAFSETVSLYGRARFLPDVINDLTDILDSSSAPTLDAPGRYYFLTVLSSLNQGAKVTERALLQRALLLLVPHDRDLGRITRNEAPLTPEARRIKSLNAAPNELADAAQYELVRRAIHKTAQTYESWERFKTLTGEVRLGSAADALRDLQESFSARNSLKRSPKLEGLKPEELIAESVRVTATDESFRENFRTLAQAFFDGGADSKRTKSDSASGWRSFLNYNPIGLIYLVLKIFCVFVVGRFLWMAHKVRKLERIKDKLSHEGNLRTSATLAEWEKRFTELYKKGVFANYQEVPEALFEWESILRNNHLDADRIAALQRFVRESIERNRLMQLQAEIFLNFRTQDVPAYRQLLYMTSELARLTTERIAELGDPATEKDFEYFQKFTEKILIIKHIDFSLRNLKENYGYVATAPYLYPEMGSFGEVYRKLNRLSLQIYRESKVWWKFVRWANAMDLAHRRLSVRVRTSISDYFRIAADMESPERRVADLPTDASLSVREKAEAFEKAVDLALTLREKKEEPESPDGQPEVSIWRKQKSRLFNGVQLVVSVIGLTELFISPLYAGVISAVFVTIFLLHYNNMITVINYLGHLAANLRGFDERHYQAGLQDLIRLRKVYVEKKEQRASLQNSDSQRFETGIANVRSFLSNYGLENKIDPTVSAVPDELHYRVYPDRELVVAGLNGTFPRTSARGMLAKLALTETGRRVVVHAPLPSGTARRLFFENIINTSGEAFLLNLPEEQRPVFMPESLEEDELNFSAQFLNSLYVGGFSRLIVPDGLNDLRRRGFVNQNELAAQFRSEIRNASNNKPEIVSSFAQNKTDEGVKGFVRLLRSYDLTASLIVFKGILPAGFEGYAPRLERSEWRLLNGAYSSDRNSIAASFSGSPLSTHQSSGLPQILFIEGSLLMEREIFRHIDQLAEAPFKIVALFTPSQRADYERLQKKIGGFRKGTLEIQMGGSYEEMVRRDSEKLVHANADMKQQFAFAGTQRAQVKRVKPFVGNLILVEGTVSPWLLLEAFQSQSVFQLGALKPNSVWTFQSALPVLFTALQFMRSA